MLRFQEMKIGAPNIYSLLLVIETVGLQPDMDVVILDDGPADVYRTKYIMTDCNVRLKGSRRACRANALWPVDPQSATTSVGKPILGIGSEIMRNTMRSIADDRSAVPEQLLEKFHDEFDALAGSAEDKMRILERKGISASPDTVAMSVVAEWIAQAMVMETLYIPTHGRYLERIEAGDFGTVRTPMDMEEFRNGATLRRFLTIERRGLWAGSRVFIREPDCASFTGFIKGITPYCYPIIPSRHRKGWRINPKYIQVLNSISSGDASNDPI